MKLQDTLSKIFKRRSTGELKNITGSVDQLMDRVSEDLKLLEKEYIISSSTGEWLDEWGTWFGIIRESVETNESLRDRILAVIHTMKVTIPALIKGVGDLLKNPELGVVISEPYLQVMIHNESQFSGTHRIQDGVYWRDSVVDVFLRESATEELVNMVYRIKTAGTKIYFTYTIDLSEGSIIGYVNVNPIYWQDKISDIMARLPNRGFTLSELAYEDFISGNRNLWLESIRDTDIPMIPGLTSAYDDTQINRIGLSPATISSLMSSGRLSAISGYKLDKFDLENAIPFEDTGIVLPKGVFVSSSEKYAYLDNKRTTDMRVHSHTNRGSSISEPSEDNSISGSRNLWEDFCRSSDIRMVYSHPKYRIPLDIYLRDILEHKLDSILDLNLSDEDYVIHSELPNQMQILVEVVTVDV